MTLEATDDTLLTIDKVNEILREIPLNSLDRCDKCGAQAYVHAAIVNKPLALMFCGHHWADVESNDTFTVLRDERAKLMARPEFASLTDAL